ncbi:MAG: sugar ABC transporter permease [Faecalimonas umbilicata]|uniref:carbohydrate ABC transporter permease n=1 Tax=Faecalimonas umbilicata TaxID=1912855 RepID=UPI002431BC55|nr:sugar ABC transporter permease [Faecalimonas umbilicata]MCI5986580.1 sugar ABC transporter permease [Faecalimonas umbilicata]MDY5093924.1 sugar ABC transporter permease [Faecalimonas umbilicata]
MGNRRNRKIQNMLQFAGFGLPATLIWAAVVIIPFLYGIGITFTDWNGLSLDINFIGLKNYKTVFSDPTFLSAFLKTVIYVLFTVIVSNVVGFFLALVVTSGIRFQGLFRTGFFTPNIIGGIILGYIWNFIFSYAITSVGKTMGIESLSTSWLTDPTKALAALIIVSSWQLSGYLMVIYIAGLTNISGELLESAQIDGATGWQVIKNIKVPLVRNSITICTFLAISRSFMSFDMNLSLTAGGPYKSTELIAYKIYQTAFTSMEFGKGQAQAIVLFVIVAAISLLQVYFTNKGAED